MEDDIRKDWHGTRVNIGHDADSLNAIMEGKRKTALQSLAQRYRWFSNIAIVAMCCLLLPFYRVASEEIGSTAGLWIMVAFAVIFLVSSVMDRWLYHGVSSIDVTRMPVSEVAEKAHFYRKRHLQFVAVLLPMAFAVLGVLGWLSDDTFLIAGMATGAIIGFALGLRQLLRFMADYRTLTDD